MDRASEPIRDRVRSPLRRGLKVYVAWRDEEGRLLALEALRSLLALRDAA